MSMDKLFDGSDAHLLGDGFCEWWTSQTGKTWDINHIYDRNLKAAYVAGKKAGMTVHNATSDERKGM